MVSMLKIHVRRASRIFSGATAANFKTKEDRIPPLIKTKPPPISVFAHLELSTRLQSNLEQSTSLAAEGTWPWGTWLSQHREDPRNCVHSLARSPKIRRRGSSSVFTQRSYGLGRISLRTLGTFCVWSAACLNDGETKGSRTTGSLSNPLSRCRSSPPSASASSSTADYSTDTDVGVVVDELSSPSTQPACSRLRVSPRIRDIFVSPSRRRSPQVYAEAGRKSRVRGEEASKNESNPPRVTLSGKCWIYYAALPMAFELFLYLLPLLWSSSLFEGVG